MRHTKLYSAVLGIHPGRMEGAAQGSQLAVEAALPEGRKGGALNAGQGEGGQVLPKGTIEDAARSVEGEVGEARRVGPHKGKHICRRGGQVDGLVVLVEEGSECSERQRRQAAAARGEGGADEGEATHALEGKGVEEGLRDVVALVKL